MSLSLSLSAPAFASWTCRCVRGTQCWKSTERTLSASRFHMFALWSMGMIPRWSGEHFSRRLSSGVEPVESPLLVVTSPPSPERGELFLRTLIETWSTPSLCIEVQYRVGQRQRCNIRQSLRRFLGSMLCNSIRGLAYSTTLPEMELLRLPAEAREVSVTAKCVSSRTQKGKTKPKRLIHTPATAHWHHPVHFFAQVRFTLSSSSCFASPCASLWLTSLFTFPADIAFQSYFLYFEFMWALWSWYGANVVVVDLSLSVWHGCVAIG